MSQEQVLGQLRQILPVIGTILVSLGVMKPETVGNLTSTILVIAGPIMIIVSSVWSLVDKTKASMVSKVDAMAKDPTSPVLGVIVAPTAEGRDLANSLPGMTTVPAGTVAADNIAKAA
mgnify:FL=1